MRIHNEYKILSKDPIKQAQSGMFAILGEYKKRSGKPLFPLKLRFALCFPESNRLEGIIPPELDPNGILLFDDIDNPSQLDIKIQQLFDPLYSEKYEATDFLINTVLAPSFKVFGRLEDEIEQFKMSSKQVLTEEQERILYETELDSRKLFLAPAGSGKTLEIRVILTAG